MLNLRHLAARQRHILLQAQRRLRIGKKIIDPVFESDPDKRQAVKRRRTYIGHARSDIEADLHRYGVIPLYFLSREAGGLGSDVENNRRRIWVGLNIQSGKRNEPARDEQKKAY